MPEEQPRAASERADAQRAGQVAVFAAVLGLVAVVGILMSVNREAHVEAEAAAARGLTEESYLEASTSRAVVPADVEGAPEPEAADVERAEEGEPERERVLPSVVLGVGIDAGASEAGVLALEPVVFPASAHLDHPLTPEERYESNAFVLDVITVRADILREELEAARAAGRPALVRRLERNLAALEVESDRLASRGRAMERELGLPGTAAEAAGSTSITME